MALSQNSQITEQVIKAVRKKPLLYNPEHPFYRCKKSRAVSWTTVAQEVGLKNGNVAKTKWRNIKDCYLKHIRSHQQQRPSSAMQQKRLGFYKRFRWASDLEFLRQFLRSRQRIGSITVGKSPKKENKIDYEDDSGDHNQEIAKYYLNDTENFAVNSDSVDPSVFLQVKEKSTNDGIYHLFLSYAETFRKFTPRRQAELKVELAKLFSSAEMDELEDNKNLFNGFI